MSESEQFLSLLFEGSSGFLDIVTKSEGSDQPDDQRWFRWPEEEKIVNTYVRLREAEDVYVAVALYSEKDRSKDDRDAVARVVYADADTCHPSNFRLTPSISVQTSKGRWHCFWTLDGQVSAKDAADASHRIAKAHMHQGCDKSGWIASKILRVPGTSNLNHGMPEKVEAKYTGEIYSLAEINKAYSDISLTEISVKNEATPPMLELEALEETLAPHQDTVALYMQAVPNGGSWSERLYRFEIDLFRLGYTAQEVFTLAWNAQCNKYHPDAEGQLTESGTPISRRHNGQDVLWQEVLKAQGEYRVETQKVIADPEPDKKEFLTFLTPEERQWVSENRTFIDEFDDWVGSRSPQSSPRYRRSAAFMVLSCIYGDKCFTVPKHNPVFPNLWLLTLGPTTGDRKTTVYNRMFDIIKEWERVHDSTIFVGNTFSAEALNTTLGPRDGLVSLVSKDEVHGFFRETLGKGYMAGIKEFLTELFNGDVLIALRQNKESAQKKRARTIFNWYGIGTTSGVAKALTLEDFESGMMLRFVYAVSEPKPLVIEEELLQMRKMDHAYAPDTKPAEFVRDFLKNLRNFKSFPVEVSIPDESLHRFHDWQRKILSGVSGMQNEEIFKAAFGRLTDAVIKAMILLAISAGRSSVTMEDVLHGLRQAEWWVEDLMRMVNSVAESEFQAEVNKIEQFIASKGTRKNRANVMRTFGKYKPRQFDEMIESLIQQGRIEVEVESKITYLRAS